MAGANRRATVWAMDYSDDDAVGGAMVTGTPVYSDVHIRLTPNAPNQLLLDQGLEANQTFSALVRPASLDIRQRYEIEITRPFNDTYYGKRFRVIGEPVRTGMAPSDPRGFLNLNLERSTRAHTEQ